MTQSNILKFISVGHNIVIPELFNSRTILGANDTFSSIGYGFKELSKPLSILPRLIGPTRTDVFEIVQSAEPEEIFKSLLKNQSIDRLCLSQHQVIDFCKTHRNWLAKDYLTNFFLIKNQEMEITSANNLSVVAVNGTENLRICRFEFDYKSICSGMFPHRFIVPRI